MTGDVLLNAETGTTLGTTGGDYSLATAGAHANEEAMGALATHDGRLVSTFHDFSKRVETEVNR